MKKVLLLCCLLFAACLVQAQRVDPVIQELEALMETEGAMDLVADKKAVLEQMEQRVAAAGNSANAAIYRAYPAFVKAEILRLEAKPQESLQVLLEAQQDLDAEKVDAILSRHARSCLYQILGAVSFESGAIREAIACYQQADALMETVTEPREILEKATNTMNLGVAYSGLGDLSLAEDYYQASLSIFEANHEEDSVFFPYLLNNLSQLYYKRGAYQDALEYTEMALEKTATDTPGRTPMLLTCAAVYSILGRYAEAQQRLDEAAALMDRVGATASWRYDYEQTQMGLYSVTGHLKEAIEVGERLQKRLQQQKPFNPSASSQVYRYMASQADLLGNYEDALSYMRQAMNTYEEAYGIQNDKYVTMLHQYSRYLEYSGQKEQAGQFRQVALDWLENKYGKDAPYIRTLLEPSPGGIQYDLKVLSDGISADMAAGRPRDALAKADEAVRLYRQSGTGGVAYLTELTLRAVIIETIQDTKLMGEAMEEYNDELRRDMKVNLSYMTEDEREHYYASVIPTVHYAYLTTLDPLLAGPIYDALLLRKNFLLGAGIGLERLIADSGDASLQQTLARMKALRSGPAQDPGLPARERYRAKAQADSLENVLLHRSHDYGNFLALADLRWQDVRRALRPDEIAVEYFQSGTKDVPIYFMLVLRSDWDQPRCIPLVADEDHLIEFFANPDLAEGIYGSPEFYNVFWKPLEEYLKPGDKVYFAMDSFLNAFAFEHFPSDTGDCAMDLFELHRVSSTRELTDRKPADSERTAALFGGFDYNLSAEEVSYYASETRGGEEEWGYLPGSLDEVEAADEILRGRLDIDLYTGEEGLESRFKALSGAAPDLLHVATHGYYFDGEEDPMERSGLVFSGANALKEEGPAESGEDGLLTAAEISQLDLRGTDLIVLSACQSGVGSISSDGVYGLQRAFKKAGVRSILMSLWKVNDQVTAEMMRLFYTNLAAGQDIRAAFQAARETLRQTYPDPLLWAPFVLLES